MISNSNSINMYVPITKQNYSIFHFTAINLFILMLGDATGCKTMVILSAWTSTIINWWLNQWKRRDQSIRRQSTPSNVTPSAVTPSVVTQSVVTPSVVTPSAVTPSAVLLWLRVHKSANSEPKNCTGPNLRNKKCSDVLKISLAKRILSFK